MLICQTEAAISARLLLLPAWRIRKCPKPEKTACIHPLTDIPFWHRGEGWITHP